MNDGLQEEVSIEIYILGENFDPTVLPSTDPIQVTLQAASCSGFPGACQLSPAPVPCLDNCTVIGTCCNTAGKAGEFDCTCDAGSGGGCCFSADTLVTMADYTMKPIGSVQVGDKILAYNPTTNSNEENEVEEIMIRVNRDMYLFTLDNSTTMIASDDHPFYVVGKGYSSLNPNLTQEGYSSLVGQVSYIKKGDELLHVDGTHVKINSIQPIAHPQKVYTFNSKLKTSPNFYANNVLVY
jgi:hypothetical protein